ncbi:MAG: hypothetical protein PUB73_06345 [Bacteroidales bacterium]|nr:hypothetical protein [Bacteroidales bacterium]
MNNNATEAYEYYKELYAPFIIFFHINNTYQAFFEDAEIISTTLKIPTVEGRITIPSQNILDLVGELSTFGKQAKMISYRDDSGRYCLPDVAILKADKEADI